MMQQYFKQLRAHPIKAVLVVLLTLLLLTADYVNRLHTPLPERAAADFSALLLPAQATEPMLTAAMRSWLAQHAAVQTGTSAAPDDTAVQQASEAALLAGATELDNMRLVVRATFVSVKLKQRLALIELQTAGEQPELLTAREGQQFGRFRLQHIGVHQLQFTDPTQPAQTAIIAPVFAGASTLQQGLNDASDD